MRHDCCQCFGKWMQWGNWATAGTGDVCVGFSKEGKEPWGWCVTLSNLAGMAQVTDIFTSRPPTRERGVGCLLLHVSAALLCPWHMGFRVYWRSWMDWSALTLSLSQVSRGENVPLTLWWPGVSPGGCSAGTRVVLPPCMGTFKQGSFHSWYPGQMLLNL